LAKKDFFYECSECGKKYTRWQGRCSVCEAWNSIVEIRADTKVLKKSSGKDIKIYSLNEIEGSENQRFSSCSSELDRVLGGGIVKGSAVLIGGEPGIGKSTLLLQIADKVSKTKLKVLYVSAEESLEQVKLRADRIAPSSNNIKIVSLNSVWDLVSVLEKEKFDLIIVDSIQTVYDDSIVSPIGSFSQIRQTISVLIDITKRNNTACFFIGHVTKEGSIAGPKLIEHMVDCVIYFEGDDNINYRIIRAIKNRFGATNEVGIFEMKEEGLCDVNNASSFFISNNFLKESLVVGSIMTGNRAIMVEIQSLINSSYIGIPRRTILGYENNRVAMLLAILEKYLHYNFSQSDVYINITGGLKSKDTALDLPILSSIIASYLHKKLNTSWFLLGELGLAGEVRSVSRIKERVAEASKLGFTNIIIPKNSIDSSFVKSLNKQGIVIEEINKLDSLIDVLSL